MVHDRLRRPLLARRPPTRTTYLRAALHTIDTRHQRQCPSATDCYLKTRHDSTSAGEHGPLRRCRDVIRAAGPPSGRGLVTVGGDLTGSGIVDEFTQQLRQSAGRRG
jgi:hypothetical protein